MRSWYSLALGKLRMRRLNLATFMQLAVAVEVLANADPAKPADNALLSAAFRARDLLNGLMREAEIPLSIPASRRECAALLPILERMISLTPPSMTGALNPDFTVAYDLYSQAGKVRAILQSELAVQAVYYLWPKRAYDPNLLVDRAVCLFAPEIRGWFVAEELQDIDQAGKCLAFETGTAARSILSGPPSR